MRTRGLWLVLALLAGAPATAACPPAGRDKAALETLKADGFKLDDKAARASLALGLVACLGDADPALRDAIGYEALSHWMRADQFDAGFLRRLRDALYLQLDASDPLGVLHPFAALALSEVARTDRIAPWMRPDERAAMLERAIGYLGSVRDYRGFEPGIGWRHGVAHGADWLLQLSLKPSLDVGQLRRIVDAVSLQAVPEAGHAYVFGEPARLARPVAWVARRGLLSQADWQAWLDALGARVDASVEASARDEAVALARRHDLVAFLSALYIEADASDNASLRALKPMLGKALAGG